MATQQNYQGLIDKYRTFLPVTENTPIVTLLEGNTPLIPLTKISQSLPGKLKIWAKFEGLNPTGSFKDRGMTLAISKAKEANHLAVICASTGNTSAAAAAYAARAGMQCFVLIPEGKIALGKLAQALIHGAKVIQIEGNFDDGMALVKTLAKDAPIEIVNSVNPFRPEGQKTAAFEVVDILGKAPDYHCLPVGNAANITAYWQGYKEYYQLEKSTTFPKMIGYQAAGAAPFIHQAFVDRPETLATAIRIGHPQSWHKAQATQQESQGWFRAISDKAILQAQAILAKQEGLFAEPASAAAIAGILLDSQAGQFAEASNIVVTLTGHGLKDPDIAIETYKTKLHRMKPKLSAIEKFILDSLEH